MKTKSNLLNLIISSAALGGCVATMLFASGCSKATKSLTPLTYVGSSPSYTGYSPAKPGPAPAGGPAPACGPAPALPYSREELWIIARDQLAGQISDDSPGSGALMAQIEGREIPMPLKHTDVRASISGYISSVEVNQQFQNPYSSKIEAVYVF